METVISFGDWVRRRRKALDLTQQELAHRAGCSLAALQKIERDERRPSRQLAALLAEQLQVPADQRDQFIMVARGERMTETLAPLPQPVVSPAERQSIRPELPGVPTPLIGREAELAEITRLLQDPSCRLLTLTGLGGIGKTRLALQAEIGQQGAFMHGAAFVPLAAVAGREQVVTAIADALGFVLYGATDRALQLIDHLRAKALLLVLDNFEHLLTDTPCVALVGDLLREAPAIKLLVTAREQLHLQAEWVLEVQGLPIPEHVEAGELEINSAVQLFVQRAQQARVGFALTAEERPAVLQICRLVQGLPLGIELAAAWVRTLSCREIAHQIERGLNILALAARDMPERHRSLSAVFDHSWKLLSTEEQRTLRQLSVFQGGFTREAAEQVAGSTLPLLSALVGKSLVQASVGERYTLHELVRQYAFDHLQANPEEITQTQNCHCEYYVTLLERKGTALKGSERSEAVAELIAELANIRLSWSWAATQRYAERLSQAADTLFWLYESRCNCREGVPLFGRAVQSLEADEGSAASPTPEFDPTRRLALGHALSYQGFFCFRQGQLSQGRELLQRSLALLRPLSAGNSLPDRAALANTTAFLGTVVAAMGDYAEGRRLLREGLLLMQALDDKWGAAFCLRQLGLADYYAGEYHEAHRSLSQSLALSREMGNQWAVASALNTLSKVAYAQGAFSEVVELIREGLALSTSIDDQFNMAQALNISGLVADRLGQTTEARRLIGESIALSREIGDRGTMAQTLATLGDILYVQGDRIEARRSFREALQAAVEAEVTPVTLRALLGLAQLGAPEGTIELALEIAMYVHQHPASPQETKDQAGKLRAELEAQLTPRQIEAAHVRAQETMVETLAAKVL